MSNPRDDQHTPSTVSQGGGLLEDVLVLGRKIGLCDDFDECNFDGFIVNNFRPSPGVDLAEGHLEVNYTEGLFKYYNDKGDIVDTRDIIAVVERLPRS